MVILKIVVLHELIGIGLFVFWKSSAQARLGGEAYQILQ